MYWAIGNQVSVRTFVIGFAVVVVISTVAVTAPRISLPHFSFSFAAAAAPADPSVLTVTSADAATASALVTSVDYVHTQEDLVSYADYLIQSDARISQIQLSPNAVTMTYQTENRILNVKTVSGSTKATVHGDGTVSIAGSWIRPLFTHVAQASSPNVGFSDISMTREGADLSPVTEAHILARLHGRFQIGAIQ